MSNELPKRFQFEPTKKEADREEDIKRFCIAGIYHAVKADYISEEHAEELIDRWFGAGSEDSS